MKKPGTLVIFAILFVLAQAPVDAQDDGYPVITSQNLRDLALVTDTTLPETTLVSGFAWSPDGQQVAVGLDGNSVALVEASTGLVRARWQFDLTTYPGYPPDIPPNQVHFYLDFSPDGSRLAAGLKIDLDPTGLGSYTTFVIVWDVATGTQIGFWASFGYNVAFHGDSETLFVGDMLGALWLTIKTGEQNWLPMPFPLRQPRLSPDDRLMVGFYEDNLLWTYVATGEAIARMGTTPESGPLKDFFFSPDGQYFLTTNGPNGVDGADNLYVSQLNGDQLTIDWLEGGFSRLEHPAVSPDNGLVAGGVCFGQPESTPCPAAEIWLWDMPTTHLLYALPIDDQAIEGLSFSPDGTMLVAVISDGAWLVWRVVE